MRLVACALAAVCALGACAAPSTDGRADTTETFLIKTLPQAVEGRPHLWFVGLAMQDETWSENDVVETVEQLGKVATRFQVGSAVFSNHQPDPSHQVESRSVEQRIEAIARQAAPEDVVMVYASTHGAPGLLGREMDGQEVAPVGIDELERWLAPLRGHDTVVILSACFSGSFIPALADAHRIIITAARADRPSFGCQAEAEHTVFGEALLGAIQPDSSLHVIVNRTRQAVTARERVMSVPAPSLPQVYVGADVKQLYDAPVF